MRVNERRIPTDIKIISCMLLLSILFIFIQLPLRVLSSLFLILFAPGYALVSVLFPRKEDLTGIERFTLAIVLSIAVTIFDGFILNYTHFGFCTESIVISLSAFSIATLLVSIIIRAKLPESERFDIELKALKDAIFAERGGEKPTEIEKALIISLIIAICIAAGIIIYAKITFPKEQFTAFYILGEGGRAENYKTDFFLGEEASFLVGVENHEASAVNYTLKVLLGGSEVARRHFGLKDGEKWLGNVSFVVTKVGPRIKLEFLLFKEEGGDVVERKPYRELHIWITSRLIERPEIVRKYALKVLPDVENGDFEAGQRGWTFVKTHPFFRGMPLNASTLEEMHREKAKISGFVVDAERGFALPHAKVHVSDRYGWSATVETNESGYYEVNTIDGRLFVACWRKGYEKEEKEVSVSEGDDVLLNFSLHALPVYEVRVVERAAGVMDVDVKEKPAEELPPQVVKRVRGVVVDEVSEKPVAGAKLRFYGYGFYKEANTSERGMFEVLSPKIVLRITAQAEGYVANETWINASKVDEIEIKMTPEKSLIRGFVCDDAGNPIEGVRIRAGDAAEEWKQIYHRETESDASGYYELRTKAGKFWLRAEKEGFLLFLKEYTVEYGEEKVLNITLRQKPKESSVIQGRVIYNGKGVKGVKVNVKGEGYEKEAVTNDEGYYKLKVPAGNFVVFAEPEVYSAKVNVSIREGEEREVNIIFESCPLSYYEIAFPSGTESRYGDYGEVYQDIYSEDEGIAIISFKVCDSYTRNESAGYHFKQALLNGVVIWEDDVAGDEGWEEVKIPVTLNRGENRIAFRVYEKRGVGWFPVKVWFDDIRIEPVFTD